MLGSSMSSSFPNTVLNAIVAESLNEIADQLDGIKYLQDVREKALEICRNIIHDHKRVLFSGDGYSEEWIKEAARRGLPSVKSFIEAVEVLSAPEVVGLFTKLGIYTEKELSANKTILGERYNAIMGIEVRTMIEMAKKEVLPAMTAELNFYANALNSAGKTAPKFVKARTAKLSEMIDSLDTAVTALSTGFEKAISGTNIFASGKEIYYKVRPLMDDVRAVIDAYEEIASREFYKLPLYEDMLFNL